MLEQIFEIATGQVSASDMLQELYADVAWTPSREWPDTSVARYVPDWFDAKANIQQDLIATRENSNPTVGFLSPDLERDMRKIDLMQTLRHHPELREKYGYAGWSDAEFRGEINRILVNWGGSPVIK